MIYSFYPIADATLYESDPLKNTGNDAVLDLSKQVVDQTLYNNRVLLKFDASYIASVMDSYNIVYPGAQFYLNLYAVEQQEVPSNFTVEVYRAGEDWTEGIGRYVNDPKTTDGVSWINASKASGNAVPWSVASVGFGQAAEWTAVEGGATWITDPVATTSVLNYNGDIRVDVTDIVMRWVYNDPNYGFLIKKSTADETSTTKFVELKYFSKDTNTIYLPKLEMAWNDATYVPGNLPQPDYSKQLTIAPKNLKNIYKESSKARINVSVREKYPTITFATQSNYLQTKQIPSSSFFYSIQHADTNETVIPFDTTYTKISCDSTGNFFNLWMDSLQVERYYKIVFRVDSLGAEEYIDNNFIFKVTR